MVDCVTAVRPSMPECDFAIGDSSQHRMESFPIRYTLDMFAAIIIIISQGWTVFETS